MVEVNEILRVSAEDFFKQIASSIAYDITEATGKKFKPNQIRKGYRYTKKIKKKVEVQVTIMEYEVPTIYKAKFESVTGSNTMCYKVKQLEDSMIEVSYIEDYETDLKLNKVHSKITTALYKGRAKKKAKRLLTEIENYILEEKDKSSLSDE